MDNTWFHFIKPIFLQNIYFEIKISLSWLDGGQFRFGMLFITDSVLSLN